MAMALKKKGDVTYLRLMIHFRAAVHRHLMYTALE